jgi:DNA (cytosine-5)-methyltransferase 1
MVYYNEFDPFAAEWLKILIAMGQISFGHVDTRSIEDVYPSDLAGYDQCHFFAGIGGWSYALRLAGVPDNFPVWTGSCPCQPFSQTGKGGGFTDERHLWPAFFHLIEQCKPQRIFGEQVASKAGLAWLDLVLDDLEGSAYSTWEADICASSIGAPHIRQRLYWTANTRHEQKGMSSESPKAQAWGSLRDTTGYGNIGGMGNASSQGLQEQPIERGIPNEAMESPSGQTSECASLFSGPTEVNGFWRDTDWLRCRDDKWRPVESCTFPLAYGISKRMGRLRGYGNAIVPQQAAEFVKVSLGELL